MTCNKCTRYFKISKPLKKYNISTYVLNLFINKINNYEPNIKNIILDYSKESLIPIELKVSKCEYCPFKLCIYCSIVNYL